MTPAEVKLENLRERTCGHKIRYRTFNGARRVSDRLRKRGVKVTPYPCPFADDHHWHNGHPPCMETVELIARAIRGLPLVDVAA